MAENSGNNTSKVHASVRARHCDALHAKSKTLALIYKVQAIFNAAPMFKRTVVEVITAGT